MDSGENVEVKICSDKLDLAACFQKASVAAAGGLALFAGTVRDKTQARDVLHLIYEAYEPMALREMAKIALSVTARWEALRVVIHHRTGELVVGDTAVIIAVSTPHRAAAFEACRYAIDTLKETVPIWKKEVFRDGEEWVSAHP